VAETTREGPGHVVGREAELAALETFMSSAELPRVFVFTGAPGIGKTTLWEQGVELARRRGFRVLSARGSGAETQLAFAALIDLLDGIDAEELTALPLPQRRALEVALFRAEPTRDAPARTAVGVGFLNVLRTLATQQPLLVAIDDLQWLDDASAEAIAFAARRLSSEAVAFLLARRPGPPSDVEGALENRPLEHFEVEQLSLGATRVLLDALGVSVPRSVLRRIFDATLGNPLFTLELGRTLAAQGTPRMGDDLPVPREVDELLGARVGSLPASQRRILLALALQGDLRVPEVSALADSLALEDAVAGGIVVVDGGRVRPSHPLLALAARTQAEAADRRAVHRELAQVVADEELRALHLALATTVPDETLARTIAAAAADAFARGARGDAVVLAEHTLRLTPADRAERSERVLVLGSYLEAAGDPLRLTELIVTELKTLAAGAARARAFLLLGSGVVASNDAIRGYLNAALAEGGADEAVRLEALLRLAENDAVIRVTAVPQAEEAMLEAVQATRGAGGAARERRVSYALAWPRALRGRPLHELCERFRAASDAASYVAASPERVAGQQLVWRGRTEAARELLTRLVALADEYGETWSYVLQRLHMCELELRIGDCDAAARLLDEWAASSERVMWPMYERCRALLAATSGTPEEAERWAAEAISRCDETGMGWDRLEALRARGMAALLAGDAARAAEALRSVWGHTDAEGVEEPGVFPVAPELVEALVELEEPDEARRVTERLETLAREQEHPWGSATAKRCRAVISLAEAPDVEAADDLAEVADAYGALGLRFDRARSLLALGRAQRRLKKWSAARDALEEAASQFGRLGSIGWADAARAEQERIGGRRPTQRGVLTPSERRVAELAGDGLANKEIAATLFISVSTVELHLKNAYAKLGIRSRTQLASRLSENA